MCDSRYSCGNILKMERCEYCPNVIVNNYEQLIKHLHQFHANTPNLVLKCNVLGCPKTFTKFNSRRAHISKNHRVQERDNGENVGNVVEGIVPNDAPDDARDGILEHEQRDDLQEQAESQFLLALRAQNVTAPIIKCVIDNCKNLVNASLRKFCERAERALGKHGIALSDSFDIEPNVAECSNVFVGVETSFRQNACFRDKWGAICPTEYSLTDFVARDRRMNILENRGIAIRAEKFYYVSILKVIGKLLAHPDYPKLIEKNARPNAELKQSYTECSYFSNHNLFKFRPDALQILLYFDEVNIVDTASTRPVSMGYFYFTLANIHPRFRAKLDFIHLVIAVESEYLKGRMNSVLEPLVVDLKRLEEGVVLNGSVVYGATVAFLGDNKAQHVVGGFKEGFSATHPCRYCMATLDQVRHMTREDSRLLRTRVQYNDQVERLKNAEGDAALLQELSEAFGINRPSVLNTLNYFNVIGGLVPDPFHDHIHLQIGTHVQLLLRHFLVGRWKIMSRDDFNGYLLEHDYGFNESKPSQISESHLRPGSNLHQTGAQMWSLAWVLPFILGPQIDYTDEYWSNYLDLLQISSLVLACEFSDGIIDHLTYLIERYYCKFLELYDGKHLLPRQHYLLHYPRLMERLGPLYQFITFRFEAKHQWFKELFKKFKCYKNPGLTSANQHEFRQAYLFSGSLLKPNEQGPLKPKSRFDVEYSDILPADVNVINTVPWITISGSTYKSNQCFVLLNCENDIPKFGFVIDIIYVQDKPSFICRTVHTVGKDIHFCSYEIVIGESLVLVDCDELYVWITFFSRTIGNKYYIPMRRSVGDLL